MQNLLFCLLFTYISNGIKVDKKVPRHTYQQQMCSLYFSLSLPFHLHTGVPTKFTGGHTLPFIHILFKWDNNCVKMFEKVCFVRCAYLLFVILLLYFFLSNVFARVVQAHYKPRWVITLSRCICQVFISYIHFVTLWANGARTKEVDLRWRCRRPIHYISPSFRQFGKVSVWLWYTGLHYALHTKLSVKTVVNAASPP